MIKLAANALRNTVPDAEHKKNIKRNPIYIILDNVLDTYNVGAVFRLADAVAATKVILCGETETPPNTRIKRASINTTEWMDWEYYETAVEAISNLKSQISNIQIISVELDNRAVPYDSIEYTFPVAIVVGHETTGVTEEVMKASDYIVELPMYGVNISLNVMVSLGIVLYEAVRHMNGR